MKQEHKRSKKGRRKKATKFEKFERVELETHEKSSGVEYIYQPKIAKVISEKSNFIRWLEKERLRLSGLSGKAGSDHFDREYQIFEQESEKRSKKLHTLFEKAEKERQVRKDFRYQKGSPPPSLLFGFPPPPPPLPIPLPWPEGIPRPLYGYEYYTVQYMHPPFKRTVYHGSRPSDNIVMKPDDEHWRALFHDAETTLNMQYRYWLPNPSSSNFTGEFAISPSLSYSGLVSIKSGGKVTVTAETAVGLRQCTHEDKHHDADFHYDRAYDSVIDNWYSKCQFPESFCVEDTQYGVHSFPGWPGGYVCAIAEGSVGAGWGFFLDVAQIITINAENANVHFELNNVGTIHTPHPTLTLCHRRGFGSLD
ncbi:hypothetical protein ACFL4V_00390 [Candidatus Latescibacterota bacterium]